MRLLIALLATAATLLTQHALAAEPLTATLEARKVLVAGGKEQFAAASEAKPGDVLEYRAATGKIEWTLAGSLLPGATGTVTFQVTIQ